MAAVPAVRAQAEPAEVRFFGPTSSPISGAVAVPAARAFFFTSGTAPAPLDDKAAAGSREHYGDTRAQGASVLNKIAALLAAQGLGLKDVVFLRVYLAADKLKGSQVDYQGWFDAYGQFFGTPQNPVKPARSTLGVAGLVNPEWLVEIEAVAVYPAGAPTAGAVPGEKKAGP